VQLLALFLVTILENNIFKYKTLEGRTEVEFKDRGSRFIAYPFFVQNIDEVKSQLKALKLVHPKANHHCYAYRLGFDKNSYRAVDDGEPAGSAGRPILGAIDGAEITNTLIVVVRYFGGTLLGVPGLIHAYKTAAAMAIDNCTIVEKEETIAFTLEFEYGLTGSFNQLLNKFSLQLIKMENALFCKAFVEVPRSLQAQFCSEVDLIFGMEIVG
jgi:uncharacterized YigZ family protein